GLPVDRDLLLHDLVDHDLEVGASIALDERACAVDQLGEPTLDEGGQLEAAAEALDDLIALEGIDHGSAPGSGRARAAADRGV
ncbi:MAG: hypothetical protein ACK559_26330, partial [bacterium]